jgi:uncharacterized protein (DUF433 family)
MALHDAASPLTVGQWIKASREQQGISGIRLARLLGVYPGRISNWEQGREFPPEQIEKRLRELFEGDMQAAPQEHSPLCPKTHVWLDDRDVAWIDDTNTKVKEVVLDRLAGGLNPEEILREHSHLSLAQIYAAFAYYYDHQAAIDAQIRQDGERVEELRREAGEHPFVKRMRAEGRLP